MIGRCMLALLGCIVASASPSSGQGVTSDHVVTDNANLRSISFIDLDRGWVSGERGVILHTQDGGLSWNGQPCPSSVTLARIAMFNTQRGLAVGGETQPYTQTSRGEVVITKDGGQSWTLVTGHDLPRIRGMITGTRGRCVAVGDWSPVYLTAIFESSDGGATWQPRPCDLPGSLDDIAGNVDDFVTLGLLGDVVRHRDKDSPEVIFSGAGDGHAAEKSWNAIAGHADTRVLSGPRGLIVSDDAGSTWRATSSRESVATGGRESASLSIWDHQCWIAKSTTNEIVEISLHESDPSPTSSRLESSSIRAVSRMDRDRGWAVGDFGTILLTRDRGQTWRCVRGADRAPAVMFVSDSAESLPWSIIATESLQHQRRIALVVQPNPARWSAGASDHETIVDAMSLIGPATALQTDGSDDDVRRVVSFARPAVVLLDSALPESSRIAWAQAALQSGCDRVIDYGPRGAQTVHMTASIPAAGILASDVWFGAVARLCPAYLPPATLRLTPRLDSTGDSLSGDALASRTMSITRYGWQRTEASSRRHYQILQGRAAEATWVDSLVSTTGNTDQFKSQLAMMLARMNEDDRARMLSRLISLTAGRDQPGLHVASILAASNLDDPTSTPHSPVATNLARLATLRLDSISNSVEWRRSYGSDIASMVRDDVVVPNNPEPIIAPGLAVQVSPFETVLPTSSRIVSSPSAINPVRLASAQQLMPEPARVPLRPESVDLRWAFDPVVLMVQRATQQRVAKLAVPGNGNLASTTAITNLQRLARSEAAGRWKLLATDQPTPEMVPCSLATSQPHLDGVFDEPWWSEATIANASQASLRCSHDANFLYLSISAPLLDPSDQTSKQRRRDTPMNMTDRYRIRIDLDRDLMTAYELEFDRDGNTRDTVDGFPAFNPRWYIACVSSADGTRTIAEIAIQKSDLWAPDETPPAIWNVAIDRLNSTPAAPGISMPDQSSWMPVRME